MADESVEELLKELLVKQANVRNQFCKFPDFAFSFICHISLSFFRSLSVAKRTDHISQTKAARLSSCKHTNQAKEVCLA